MKQEIASFIADMKAQGNSQATVKSYTAHLNKFAKWCEENGVDFKTAVPRDFKLFRNYLISQDYAPNTVNMHLYALKTFYDYLVEEGVVSGNPVLTSRLAVKEENRAPGFLTDEELEAVMKHIELEKEDIRLAFKTMLATGLRVSEIVALSPADIIKKGDIVLVHVRRGKRKKERYAPVTDAQTALELLEAKKKKLNCLRIFNMSVDTLQKHAKKIGQKVGIKFNPHRLRHTLGTNLLAHYPIDVVQEVLGHENIATTRRYAVTLPRSFFQVAARVG